MIVTKVCTRKQDRDTNLSRLSYLTCEAKNIRKRFCCSVLLFILTRIWIGYLSGNSDFLDDSIQLNGASMRRCWWQQQIQYFFHMCSSTPDEKSDLLFFWHEYEAYTSLIYLLLYFRNDANKIYLWKNEFGNFIQKTAGKNAQICLRRQDADSPLS